MPIFHITTITRRASRRIMGAVGTRRNWCGAAPTDHDVDARDARRVVRTGYQQPEWARCETCFGLLMRQDFQKSRRAED